MTSKQKQFLKKLRESIKRVKNDMSHVNQHVIWTELFIDSIIEDEKKYKQG